MVTTRVAIGLKKFAQKLASGLQIVALLFGVSIFVQKFAWMNFDGLLTVGASVFAVFVGTTSLLYNRARAYPVGRVQRRTLFAAEHCLRATLLLVIGALYTSVAFLLIPESFRTDPTSEIPKHYLPMIVSIPGVLMIAFSSYAFVGALAAILPPMITSRRRKHRFRQEFPR